MLTDIKASSKFLSKVSGIAVDSKPPQKVAVGTCNNDQTFANGTLLRPKLGKSTLLHSK